MTQPLVSILLPHLRNSSNDAALRICLDCLVTNTGLNYHLDLEAVAERRDIYTVLNRMAQRAPTEWIVPFNSDTFPARRWLEPMWEVRQPHTLVSPILVECGAIPVNNRNLERDFGRTPQTFRRSDFEAWAINGDGWRDDWCSDCEAWYHPALIERDAFLALGGYDTTLGAFPAPVDMDFHERWQAAANGFRRVRSYFYHMQNWSSPERGER